MTRAEALLAAPPLRAIVRLAAPTTLVMLISAVSNILYTYYVSRLGEDAIAAVALVFPFALLANTAMAGGIGAGASSAVARALGGGRRAEAARIAEHALALAIATGILFGLAILGGARGIFGLMGGKGVVLDLAAQFARVVFGGAAITFVAGMLDSILRGEGNVRVPTIWSSTSLGLQILLTPIFMFVFHLGLVGAALAMLVSQFLAAIPRVVHLLGDHGMLRGSAWPPRFSLVPIAEILRVGVPASLSMVVANGGVMVLTGVLARFGNAHLAAYGLGTRLDFLFLSLAYGVGAAVLTLVGLASGAGRPEMVRDYVRRSAVLIVVVLGIPSALLWLHPTAWMGLFTKDAEILAVGAQYLRIIGPSYPLVGLSMLVSFAFQGFGRATAPLALMVTRTVLVLGVAIVETQWLGLRDQAVFATIAIGNACSAGFALLLLYRALPAVAPAEDLAA